ncbi:phage tail protein [Veillonella sp.]|uniref:phage tail-collar fiber domain-containing protein n=1 Tax=Veillonella sp. TaxID=1926307 RepID=UPI0029072740|nr:phage tail protein [Veillonella sp.]MDU4008642.1 phage tail protein [Veillonella sp.]
MAKYPAVITTMAGTNIIAEANASKQALIFTKIVIGAGDMPASIPRATALTDKRLELAITKSVKTGDGQFMVQGLLSNKNLEAGFYAREIGLMAKAGENGQEVLFSYTNGGNYVDYIPDKNTPMDSYTFTITTVVGNAEKVQAIVSDNGVASVHDLEAHNMDPGAHGGLLQNLKNQLSTHNTDVSSHPAITEAIAKILGATDWQENPVATLKDIKTKLGEGGIVAQRFGESGFVKYANGFTIQWGHIADGKDINRIISISLILPCNGKYVALPVGESNNTNFNNSLDHPCVVIAKLSTSFKVQIDDYMTGISWVCLGIC